MGAAAKLGLAALVAGGAYYLLAPNDALDVAELRQHRTECGVRMGVLQRAGLLRRLEKNGDYVWAYVDSEQWFLLDPERRKDVAALIYCVTMPSSGDVTVNVMGTGAATGTLASIVDRRWREQ